MSLLILENLKKEELDGFLIYVGRDAKSNDHLTFNIADNDDMDAR